MRKILSLLALLVLLAAVGIASAQDTAYGTVVHGIPGLPVDVYVDGQLAVPGFQPGTIVGPLPFPAGTYDVALVPAGGDPASPALAGTLTFTPGQNFSLIAHLKEDGTPAVAIFDNNVSPTSGSRVTIRHLAAAPAVDAVVSPGTPGQTSYGPLSNGQEATLELPAGSLTAGLAPAGTSTIIYGPSTLNLPSGTLVIAYAVGSLSDGTFNVLLQSIPVGS